MAEEKEQDRSEEATPFKLREARKQGQVARSAELTAWAIMLAATATVYIFGRQLVDGDLRLSEALFSQSGHIALSKHSATLLFAKTSVHILSALWFVLAVIIACGLLVNFMQIGPVFSAHPLKPDFKRLNPATGFKRLFNKRILFEAGKTLLKTAVVTGIATLFIHEKFNALMALPFIDVHAHAATVLKEVVTLAFWLLGGLGAISLIDFGFAKWEFSRNMRMSKRELRDEHKRREGDPKIKQRMRELQREAAMRGASVSRVPEADVVITNPTHLSVAVQYLPGKMAAPIVIAKGAGDMALRIRIMARQHSVPLVENKPVARKLFERVRIDEPIVPETYADIARILTQLQRSRSAPKHQTPTHGTQAVQR